MNIKHFTFNPFQENTYLLWSGHEAVIIDPGMMTSAEENQIHDFIKEHNLELKRCLLTHCHIDHVLGLKYIESQYGLLPEFHADDMMLYESNDRTASMYGIPYNGAPEPGDHLKVEDKITFGEVALEIRFVPGHAPGHVVFIDHASKQVIAGDTLFQGSIGRTDLPGGNHEQLIDCIKKELFTLDGDYQVHSGHGPSTSIGFEKENNPFF